MPELLASISDVLTGASFVLGGLPEPFHSIFDVLKKPHWLTFILVGGVGLSGFLALLFLYPISRDTDDDTIF